MIDCHTHTKLSHDGNNSAKDMVERAEALGLTYYAVTDHMDRDYIDFSPEFYQINLKTLTKTVEKLKNRKNIYVALGVECGYSDSSRERYAEELPLYPFDIILNSLHTLDGTDIYYPVYFDNKTQRESYAGYFEGVLKSVDAPYPYDVITHFGYIVRNAPYRPKTVAYSEYADYIDAVLKRIIEKGKCLEVNANIICEASPFCPNAGILKRYRELGGELISYGSDAHRLERIAFNFDLVAEHMKNLGFKFYTVYKNRKPEQIKI